jgi:hypothetical protein
MSTQDAYSFYAKNWILPRWRNVLLEDIKTVEVERWVRAADVADGTKSKIKCAMSACFRTPFARNSAPTTRSPREFKSEREEERSKHWRSRQCEAPANTPVLVAGASETWARKAGIPGPVACLSGWSAGDSSRRARRSALVGLPLREHDLQHSTQDVAGNTCSLN